MKNKILWFFVTNYGRYALGIILALTGVFSQYGTIGFLSTDWALFEYTAMAGVGLLIAQFMYHVIYAVVSNIKD